MAEKNAKSKFEETLKRLLRTPPKPHKDEKKDKGKSKKKKSSRE